MLEHMSAFPAPALRPSVLHVAPLLWLLWSLSATYQHISSVSEAQLYNAPFMALWREMAVGRRNSSRPSPQ